MFNKLDIVKLLKHPKYTTYNVSNNFAIADYKLPEECSNHAEYRQGRYITLDMDINKMHKIEDFIPRSLVESLAVTCLLGVMNNNIKYI